MSTGSRMPASFSEVFNNNTWESLRDYGVRRAQDEDEFPQPQLKPASPPDSSRKNQQSPDAVTSRPSSINTSEAQARFYQPLSSNESNAMRGLPSPAASIRDLRAPNTSYLPSLSQANTHYGNPHFPLNPHTPILQQRIPVWNNPPQNFVTYPTPQHNPGSYGAPPLDSSLGNLLSDSPPATQYRFFIIPIVVNGIVYPCWCALPEIVPASTEQLGEEHQPSARHALPEPPAPRNFQPTNMVLEMNRAGSNLSTTEPAYEFEPYRGDLSSQSNRRQVHLLPDAHNCTLWLWNIPSALHINELFDQIDTGAVQCCHIVPPNDAHITCAAKLAFMAPEAAAKFKGKVDSEEGIWLRGYKLMARYNRDGNLRNITQQTRVLAIEGPNEFMTCQYWGDYFRKICVFQWDRVLKLPCEDPDKKILQFSFVRLDGQAQACMGAIRSQTEFDGVIQATFAPDCCGSATVREFEQGCSRLY